MSVKEKHIFVKLDDGRFEDVLNVTDASKFSGVTRQTLYTWIKKGFIEAVSIPTQGEYIIKSSLLKYLGEREK